MNKVAPAIKGFKGLNEIIIQMASELRTKIGRDISFSEMKLKVSDIGLFCDFLLSNEYFKENQTIAKYYGNPDGVRKIFGMPIREIPSSDRNILKLIISRGGQKIEKLVSIGDCIVKKGMR